MIIAGLTLITSTGLLLVYLQQVCSRLLRRKFDRPYFQTLADANGWEFPRLQEAFAGTSPTAGYAHIRLVLKCELLLLTSLLKNNRLLRSPDAFLVVVYSRLVFVSLELRHALGFEEKPVVLKLTAILEYLANFVGERVSVVRFSKLAVPDHAS